MSEFKNHYGENVAWFCADISISLDETNEDGMLDSSVEVYGEDEQGREGSTEIEVIKLLESAHVVIEEKDTHINKLQHDNDRLREALKESLSELKNYEITTGKMSFTKSRKKYLKLLKVD